MDGTGSTGFGLHFNHFHRGVEEVLLAFGR